MRPPIPDGAFVLNSDDRGWIDETGFRFPNSDNYLVGEMLAGLPETAREVRNFVVFDLSRIRSPILSATLRLLNPGSGYGSPDLSERFSVWDVSAPLGDLYFGSVTKFNDLGTGTLFGTQEVLSGVQQSFVDVSLNRSALNVLNSTQGFVALGGTVSSLLLGEPLEYLFGGSDTHNPSDGNTQLILTIIPEASKLTMLFSGLLLLGAAGLRQRWGLFGQIFGVVKC